ncbi:FtsH protease activity modulator HflK [Shimia thalassica]|jgi:membrane protease subunit HflK|uniref:FtsH protease activity modulator HflK n=1 Tax=Shimia thalassica TaxID=1715693 RepID=UPI000C07D3D8|nr:FtsH protease activity modulator HflK [Shimia thalassica]PHO02840.1 FtsH protease activity modulator HflK [Rhodobacteraceae bacterium 4F10]MBU2943135.1 FtsH protease activity modulator HflK [Shimia thalassica]MDO6479000.1 FtsH protease activity modulator HflK [Shimia thalassica]MDO6502542.1 FtsH protease activity modulator HflK [Shimia thalassica]MDO6520615.1 FtsH protease activity modulator HflK [Shimia thalassica]
MAGNSGGPWGGGGNQGGSGGGGGNRGNNGGNNGGGGGGRGPGDEGPQIPDIDELMKKGQDQLRVLMGGRGGNGTGQGGGGQRPAGGGGINKGMVALGALAAVVAWGMASFYSVKPEEKSVELFLGKYYATGEPGLNFAPWPLVTAEILPVTREQTEEIPSSGRSGDGLMLTGDENIVDIDFQVVWNIGDPAQYLFNLRDPRNTIRAVSESAMREIIAQSELAPVLNRDRGVIADRLQELIQSTLDSYDSGVNVVRVNFDGADPPEPVKDSFREVQSASQERDRLEKQADAYANRVLAGARGEAAQVLEESEAYRAQVVNEAEGEASRFSAVLEEYQKAPEVTRKRLYLETMEEVLGRVDKVIIDEQSGGQGVVPYLPLNELNKGAKQ